jgi:hypothetical protein
LRTLARVLIDLAQAQAEAEAEAQHKQQAGQAVDLPRKKPTRAAKDAA